MPERKIAPRREPDGTFRNPWPDSEPKSLRDVLTWVMQRRGQDRAPDPPRGAFRSVTPSVRHPRNDAGDYSATWIGHSTVLLQMDRLNIITDPVFSERAFPVQWMGPRRFMPPALPIGELPPLDIVLLSHSHYDHLDQSAVRHIAREHPSAHWVVPLKLGRYIERWGVRKVTELDWWESATVCGVTVTATPARHFSARRLGDRNRTLWCGFALERGNKRAFFAADTAYHPEFGEVARACGPFDLALIPIGAYDPRWFMHVVHMDPEEAVQAYVDAGASGLMLAIHWGTFRLTDEAMDEPPRRAAAAWAANGLDPARLWVAAFGETRSW